MGRQWGCGLDEQSAHLHKLNNAGPNLMMTYSQYAHMLAKFNFKSQFIHTYFISYDTIISNNKMAYIYAIPTSSQITQNSILITI